MYYRQLSAGIIRKKDKIKTIFVSPEVPKDQANKTGIDIMIFILIFMEKCLNYDAIHDFSVLLRTGSNQADKYRFRSHTRKLKNYASFLKQFSNYFRMGGFIY